MGPRGQGQRNGHYLLASCQDTRQKDADPSSKVRGSCPDLGPYPLQRWALGLETKPSQSQAWSLSPDWKSRSCHRGAAAPENMAALVSSHFRCNSEGGTFPGAVAIRGLSSSYRAKPLGCPWKMCPILKMLISSVSSERLRHPNQHLPHPRLHIIIFQVPVSGPVL